MQSEPYASASSSDVSTQVARELFLRAFLGGADPRTVGETATRLASRVVDLWLPKGHVLYRIGDVAEDHFFVVSGEMLLDGGKTKLTLGERSIIMDVTQERPRNRTATALSEVHLLRLRGSDWFDVLEDDFDFARGALHNIARGVEAALLAVGGRYLASQAAPSRRPRRGDLSFVERTLLLRAAPPFRKASVQATVELVPHARLSEAKAGDTIVAKGAPKTRFLVLVDGDVAIGEERAAMASGYPIMGMSSFSPGPWPLDVVATTDVRILELDFEDIFDAMEEHFDLMRGALAEISREREELLVLESAIKAAKADPSATGDNQGDGAAATLVDRDP